MSQLLMEKMASTAYARHFNTGNLSTGKSIARALSGIKNDGSAISKLKQSAAQDMIALGRRHKPDFKPVRNSSVLIPQSKQLSYAANGRYGALKEIFKNPKDHNRRDEIGYALRRHTDRLRDKMFKD